MRCTTPAFSWIVGLLSLAACGGHAYQAEEGSSVARTVDASESEVSALAPPLPAGRWAFEDPWQPMICVDCPTPRYVVIGATGSLAEMESAMKTARSSAPGYPFVVAREEWRLPFEAPFALVLALYREEPAASAAVRTLDGRVLSIGPPVGAPQRVVEIREDAPAYPPPGHGSLSTPPPEPRCILPRGSLHLVQNVQTVQDGVPWVVVACPEGPAWVAADQTDLDRAVARRRGVVRVMQRVGGGCAGTEVRRSLRGSDGAWTHRTLWSEPACFFLSTRGASVDGRDVWDVCPDGELPGCVRRARAVRHDDQRHALRLAHYACVFGDVDGCDVESDLVGHATAAMTIRIARCRSQGDAGVCAELDGLAERVAPASLPRENMAEVARELCPRGHHRWCTALATFEGCARDGIGCDAPVLRR